MVSEAQACGCPVVTSNLGQASHLIAGPPAIGEGIVSQPDDSKEWLNAINRMVGTPQRQVAAAKAARLFAEDTVSTDAVARAWSVYLKKVVPEWTWQYQP